MVDDKEKTELKSEIWPNPGSIEAVTLGCCCPEIENHYGEGIGEDEDGNRLFWYSSDCLIHCPDSAAAYNGMH